MARPPRIERAGAWYHVTSRGIERRLILTDKRWGRDLALYLGRKRCGLKLKQLGENVGGIDYASITGAIRRLEHHAHADKKIRKIMHEAIRQIANEKT